MLKQCERQYKTAKLPTNHKCPPTRDGMGWSIGDVYSAGMKVETR